MSPEEVVNDNVDLKENYYALLNKPEYIINDVDTIKKACVYLPELFFERQNQRIATIVRDFLKQFTGDKSLTDIWPGMPHAEYLAAVGLFCYAPYIDLAGRYSEYKAFNPPLKKFTFNVQQFENNVAPYYVAILTRQIEESIPSEILSKWLVHPGFDRIALLIGRVISNELLTVKPADKPSEMGSPVSLAISDFMSIIETQKQEIALLNENIKKRDPVIKESRSGVANMPYNPDPASIPPMEINPAFNLRDYNSAIINTSNTWPNGQSPFSPKTIPSSYSPPTVQYTTVDGFKEFAQEVLEFIRSKS